MILFKIKDFVSPKSVQHFPGPLTTQEKVKHGSTKKKKKKHKDAHCSLLCPQIWASSQCVLAKPSITISLQQATMIEMQGGFHHTLSLVVVLSVPSPSALSTGALLTGYSGR